MSEAKRIAVWVREVRGSLTQTQFASLIGRHPVTISNWERGERQLDWDSAEAICRAFPAAPPPPGVVPVKHPKRLEGTPATAEAAEIAALVDSMPPELRRAARAAVYGIFGMSTSAAIVTPTLPQTKRRK